MKDLLFAQGSITNVLKRIGVNKSNLFCVGEDPITKSGVIISSGKIVSSRILDITLCDSNKDTSITLYNNYINHINVKYIDVSDKSIKTLSFNILNDDALLVILNLISDVNNINSGLKIFNKNNEILDNKIKNIYNILSNNKLLIDKIDILETSNSSFNEDIINIKNELQNYKSRIELHEIDTSIKNIDYNNKIDELINTDNILSEKIKRLQSLQININLLIELHEIDTSTKKQEITEKLQKLEKNDIVLEEKLKKIQEFLVENKSQIECIDDMKKLILDMNNKLDLLLTERALSKTI